jgi:hypothetical protein
MEALGACTACTAGEPKQMLLSSSMQGVKCTEVALQQPCPPGMLMHARKRKTQHDSMGPSGPMVDTVMGGELTRKPQPFCFAGQAEMFL